MSQWSVEFVSEEAKQEVSRFTPELQARLVRVTRLLINVGPLEVGMPHVRPLKDKLWELRLKSKDVSARCFYTLAKGKKVVILYSFIKKTQKTPLIALKKARKRLKEVVSCP